VKLAHQDAETFISGVFHDHSGLARVFEWRAGEDGAFQCGFVLSSLTTHIGDTVEGLFHTVDT
jgi:hypothetical protein